MDNQPNVIYTNPNIKEGGLQTKPKKVLTIILILLCSVILFLSVFILIKNRIYPQIFDSNLKKVNTDLKGSLENIEVIDIDPEFKQIDQNIQKL